MLVRYFYAWIPAISLGLFLVFVIPFLGPIAFIGLRADEVESVPAA
jgi:hypothetical protein